MSQMSPPASVHCYTNPSFCRQSEYIPQDQSENLPPPPQFQTSDDLPLPPPPSQLQCNGGQSNPAFRGTTEVRFEKLESGNRYCHLDEDTNPSHRRYGSVPLDEHRGLYNQSSRYEFIPDKPKAQPRRGSSRYDFIPHQQVQQCAKSAVNQADSLELQMQSCGKNGGRYAVVPGDLDYQNEETTWSTGGHISPVRNHIGIPQRCYSRVPLQEEDPPTLSERNTQELSRSPRNNLATQKLHEILTTPRKHRSRSEERTLSPKRRHSFNQASTPQRRALTPVGSPTRRAFTPTCITPRGTPQGRNCSTRPQTSTPNKEPSARRCLPLTENPPRQQNIFAASNYGRLQYDGTASIDLATMGYNEPPPRYRYLENGSESMPMVTNSPRYRMIPAEQKKSHYQSVESAFIARTAVVPPLSPPNSDVNTTFASVIEKNDRRNAPLLLVLVGILTCGLALYLSWTQGRRYYYDSAVGCGASCALAGACRTLRKTWTGLGLAALSALSCAGLLLLAAKSPKAGTPLHDVTAGALCGVSLLGAILGLLALLAPRCNLGRHRRVHSWIPRLSP